MQWLRMPDGSIINLDSITKIRFSDTTPVVMTLNSGTASFDFQFKSSEYAIKFKNRLEHELNVIEFSALSLGNDA